MLIVYDLAMADVQGWMDRVPEIDSLIEEKGAEVATLEKESDGITLYVQIGARLNDADM
jgi:hypothetical protein